MIGLSQHISDTSPRVVGHVSCIRAELTPNGWTAEDTAEIKTITETLGTNQSGCAGRDPWAHPREKDRRRAGYCQPGKGGHRQGAPGSIHSARQDTEPDTPDQQTSAWYSGTIRYDGTISSGMATQRESSSSSEIPVLRRITERPTPSRLS